MKKPNKEDYGFIENNNFDGEGGWCVEGGEDAYFKALLKYKCCNCGSLLDFNENEMCEPCERLSSM